MKVKHLIVVFISTAGVLLVNAAPLIPADDIYKVTMMDYTHEPDWSEAYSFRETLVHRYDDGYSPICAIDSQESYHTHTNCTQLENGKEPISPFKRCRLVINEVNTDNPGSDHQNIFIELAELCLQKPTKPAKSLRGFKIILIGGATESVEMVIDLRDATLGNFPETGKRYFVIGTDAVQNVNLRLADTGVQSIYNDPGQKYKMPVGDKSPHSVVLLYSEKLLDLRDIELHDWTGTGIWESLPISDEILSKIKKFSQDQVVFGRKAPTNRCDIFEKTWFNPQILNPGKKYLLRDWDAADASSPDYSLSRCTVDVSPFLPESFKLANPTPRLVNACDDAARFILEEHISDLKIDTTMQLAPSNENPQWCQPDQQNMPEERYTLLQEDRYFEIRDEEISLAKRRCIQNDGPLNSFKGFDMEVDMNNEMLSRGQVEPLIPPYDKNNFDPGWIELAKPFLPANAPHFLENPSIQAWLRVRSTESDPVLFSCEVCSTMANHHFKIERNHNKAIMTEHGFFSTDKWKNKHEIETHNSDEVHIHADAFLREVWAQETKTLVLKMIEDKDSTASKLLLPTINMVRTVYMEGSVSIPFSKHEHIVKLQKVNGVNLGFHFYGKSSAESMMATISDLYHETLVDFLVKNDKDFSLIVDTTTDTRNIPYLTVHIQTIEGNRPVIFFYRLIPLLNGESAEETKKCLWKAIQSDTTQDRDFEGFVKRRLIAFVSDGANVMIGKKESVWVLLRKEIGRDIPSIHCMAHKLELSIKRGIKKGSTTHPDLLYFSTFNKSVNKLYVFYSSRGSKRWAHFERTAEAVGIHPARIKYFFEIRWASSHFVCLDNIYKNYKALVKDTEDISADTSFTKAAMAEAGDLNTKLTNKSWVLALHEFLNILTVYKFVSLDLQQQTGLLPGKAGIIKNAVRDLQKLKTSIGPYTSILFKNVVCTSSPCVGNVCTLEEYESCEVLTYDESFHLTQNDEEILSLVETKNILYDSIIDAIRFYFNLEELENFEMFNQKKYPIPMCDVKTGNRTVNTSYVMEMLTQFPNIRKIGQFYGMSEEEIIEMETNWIFLQSEIIRSQTFAQNSIFGP